jgi:hypothetical protein
MAKFYGPVGFAETIETSPSVWVERIIERNYFGDLIKQSRQLETSGGVNDNINISNNISIVGDPYAMDHIDQMRYAEFMGTKWKIKNVDASQYPRLMLILGGVYTG